MSKERLVWIDQAKRFGIFLVIYAHNFPFLETYIYSFHMPLFFFVSGMFHPKEGSIETIVHRAKSLLIPYFFWAFLLYTFWVLLGRHYGNSVNYNLDPLKELIGVFYAQGDIQFMDWGIPMWFLPCLFLTFLLFSWIKRIKSKTIRYVVLIALIIIGFLYPHYFKFKLPWSLDVACVALFFYVIGSIIKKYHSALNSKQLSIVFIFTLILSVSLALFNTKVDMYRSIYGNEALFVFNGLTGVLFVVLFFKRFKFLGFLSFLGQNTIPLLALQLRALTVIKLILLLVGISEFNFNEPTKFILSIVQVLLILPVIILVNKYMPILNGKIKK